MRLPLGRFSNNLGIQFDSGFRWVPERGKHMGVQLTMVVSQRSVKPFPPGKHCRFESFHSHNFPEMVDDAYSVGQPIIIKVPLKVILQTVMIIADNHMETGTNRDRADNHYKNAELVQR